MTDGNEGEVEGFNPEAATAAAEVVSPDGATETPAPAPAPSPGGAAPPAPAAPAAPAALPNINREPSLIEQAIVNFADQGVWMLTKRYAKKVKLWPQLTAQDKRLLRMSDAEKEELEMFAGGIVPLASKYADLIEKISLGLFAFALYSIYEDKRDIINRAVEIDGKKDKGPAGFGPQGGGSKSSTFTPPGPDGIKPHGN